ncbi:MAG: leucine--tRNA ligase [bacterium]|nr:leucine--tRNA ligase [Candidatus Minthenecus merdequi]
MDYNFREIEKKWQNQWVKDKTYEVKVDNSKPKFYVLDMFPYPSGAGLHVGHPLGYIASDIYSRYKRLKGFNVLHPMGYDSYGLPAEQYAIQTGQHPAVTTEKNINRYREQLDKIGFSYDWSREVRTCEPNYYKWTQWAFIQMFNHYYDFERQCARPISELVEKFEREDAEWKSLTEAQKSERLMQYRIAYLADTKVNWCPALGTVLANDEVSEGLSVRGGFPVEQKVMRQWSLRVSAYAERLLRGLETVDWTESLKETQRNWIGRSEGAEMYFPVKDKDVELEIFTTRADTVFGVTFMVLAPESQYVDMITTAEQRGAVDEYLAMVKKRTERERISDRRVTGVFTGAYAINPLTKAEIPVYVSDYVLAGYGTGAIMAVPAHDSRDYAFAKHFDLPIIPLIEGADVSEESYDAKEGKVINSGFLNGMEVKAAIAEMKRYITENGLGRVKVNYRLRDAIFSRQRYWGEPFPVYYKEGVTCVLDESKLPLLLPEIKEFKPTADGRPPLGHAENWVTEEGYPIELNTMPGFAGSSAYYLRYMDPHNTEALVGKEADEYWRQVDLYVGGTEHATGHLIYSRFWNKFLYDLGLVCEEEPYKKLVNQGMIQGRSNFVYRFIGKGATGNLFISYNLINNPEYKDCTQPIHVDVNIVNNDILDINAFRAWNPEYKDAQFVFADGSSTLDADNPYLGKPSEQQYICGYAVEKMSKSMYNVVNPDNVVEKYGADTLRLYEMFLGPLEQSKPWDTKGIDGVSRFLRKMWKLYADDNGWIIDNAEPTPEMMKALHKTIEKVAWDIENFSFNTTIPAFMVCVNELTSLKCHSRKVLEPLAVIIAPYAPHLAEELWHACGNTTTVCDAKFPEVDKKWLVEDTVKQPVAINGKVKDTIDIAAGASQADVREAAFTALSKKGLMEGKNIVKEIIIPGKMVNFVVK